MRVESSVPVPDMFLIYSTNTCYCFVFCDLIFQSRMTHEIEPTYLKAPALLFWDLCSVQGLFVTDLSSKNSRSIVSKWLLCPSGRLVDSWLFVSLKFWQHCMFTAPEDRGVNRGLGVWELSLKPMDGGQEESGWSWQPKILSSSLIRHAQPVFCSSLMFCLAKNWGIESPAEERIYPREEKIKPEPENCRPPRSIRVENVGGEMKRCRGVARVSVSWKWKYTDEQRRDIGHPNDAQS